MIFIHLLYSMFVDFFFLSTPVCICVKDLRLSSVTICYVQLNNTTMIQWNQDIMANFIYIMRVAYVYNIENKYRWGVYNVRLEFCIFPLMFIGFSYIKKYWNEKRFLHFWKGIFCLVFFFCVNSCRQGTTSCFVPVSNKRWMCNRIIIFRWIILLAILWG